VTTSNTIEERPDGISAFNGSQWSPRVSPSVFWGWVQSGHITGEMPTHWPIAHPYPMPAAAFVSTQGFRPEMFNPLLTSGSAFSQNGRVFSREDSELGHGCVYCGRPQMERRTLKLEKQNPAALCGIFFGVLPLLLLSMLLNKKATLRVSLCELHVKKLRLRRILGSSFAVFGMFLGLLIAQLGGSSDGYAGLGLGLGSIMVVAGLIWQSPRKYSLKLKSLENGIAVIGGVPSALLDQLPRVV
jgi:hypothetical protein